MKKSAVPRVPACALVISLLVGVTGCSSEGSGDTAPKKVRVTSIEPACAEPGAAGYVEGNGFGAKNVTITVGGIEAEVIKATGHDASFAVPEGIPQGAITVVATNPGGKSASIDWVTCEPACTPTGPEVCDGIDNDCNELIDDGIADVVSGSDVGECQTEIQRCVDGALVVVQPGVGPSDEVCDALDNDCSGTADDGIADLVNGSDVGECQTEIQRCVDGTFAIVQTGVGPSEEACDALDNDCNDAADDGIPDLITGTDVGLCEFEIQRCVDGTYALIQPGVGPMPEFCDGFDNNCNGIPDDGIADIITGTDTGECQPEVQSCINGAFVITQFGVGPTAELCDSLDNDCNGLSDDGIADIMTGTEVGECQQEIQSCVGGVFAVIQAGIEPSPEQCDSLDNDCNGTADDDPACPAECGEFELCRNALDDNCDGDVDGIGCGVLLPDIDELALEVVYDYGIHEGTPLDEITEDPDGIRWARSAVVIAFELDATAKEVNAILTSIDGEVVSMLQDSLVLLVEIPDPGSLEAVDAIVDSLRATEGVYEADRAQMSAEFVLPGDFGRFPSVGDIDEIAYHAAVRAPAAWNARALFNPANAPVLLIADIFGDGGPGPLLYDINPPTLSDYITGQPRTHGYMVLSVIAASWLDLFDQAIGTAPFPMDVRVCDVAGPLNGMSNFTERTFLQVTNCILQRVRALSGRKVVLNTSIGMPPPCDFFTVRDIDIISERRGRTLWLEPLRGSTVARLGLPLPPNALETQFLHAAAAGNTKPSTGFSSCTSSTTGSLWIDAKNMSPWNWAATQSLGLAPAIRNTFVVENRTVVGTGTSVSPVPGCIAQGSATSGGSSVGGNLSAIGRPVLVAWESDTQIGGKTSSGTSFASPQVAGVAMLVWTLAPNLTPEQVKTIIALTADGAPTGCAGPDTVDAYEAVLAVDGFPSYPSNNLSSAKVRKAILDVVRDDKFDIDDVRSYVTEFSKGYLAADFSRWDLNGDGKTGGPDVASFNLDASDPRVLGEVDQALEGIPLSFDERAVTDIDVLCYYAYSDLYDPAGENGGTGCERYSLLESICPCIGDGPPGCPAPVTTTFAAKSAAVPATAQASTLQCPAEICDDGEDNNGNGDIDCDDEDCTSDPVCGCGVGECVGADGLPEADGSSCAGGQGLCVGGVCVCDFPPP